jgi:DNA-binding response OmpR family regulator
MPVVSSGSADLTPIVIAVAENDLAVALEMFIQALGLPVTIHDPARGLGALPLAPHSTLIIDRQLISGDPARFVGLLRRQLWLGMPIMLVEDGDEADMPFAEEEEVCILEKPFVTSELLAIIRRAHARAA